jgi:hypothetical protein
VWHWQKGWWWHAEWGWFCSLDVANLRNKEVTLEKERAEEENQHLTQELGLFTRELNEISRENKTLKEELHGTENTIAELGDNLKGSRLRIEELEGEKQSLCDAATKRIQELDEQPQLQQRSPVITIDGEDLFRRERASKASLWNQQHPGAGAAAMFGLDTLQSLTSPPMLAEHLRDQLENEGMPSSSSVATCEPAHSACCPHVRVKCSGCGTVVPSYEAVRGGCCDFGFRDFSYMNPVDDSNRDVCWCVSTEPLVSVFDDQSCQDEGGDLAREFIAFGSLVFPRLFSDRRVGEDACIAQDEAPGAIDPGPCYLSSICRSSASFAAAERWFVNVGSFKQDADRSKFYRSVDAFERGVIDKDQYEILVVSALCLPSWWGVVDQISVVHAGQLERDISVASSARTMAGSSPVVPILHVGSDCLINLVVGGGVSAIVQAMVVPQSDSLRLKRGRAGAVRRQARRQARRRAGRQARRQARREAMRRSEKRRKEARKRHERACREAMKREQIWLCLSYFCVLFGLDQPRPSLAKRLIKNVGNRSI